MKFVGHIPNTMVKVVHGLISIRVKGSSSDSKN